MTDKIVNFEKVLVLPTGSAIKANTLYFLSTGVDTFEFYVSNEAGDVIKRLNATVDIDTALSLSSQNPVTNEVITETFNLLALPPTYVQPLALLSSNFNGSFEIGQTLALSMGLTFTQNDAGAANNYNLLKNNSSVQTNSNPFTYTENLVVVAGNTDYRDVITFPDGLIKNNPTLGFPDDRGRVLAGTVESSNRRITGRHKYWFYTGDTGTSPTDSAGVRSLSEDGLLTPKTFDITVTAGQKEVSIYLSQAFSLESVLFVESANTDITDSFVETSMTVNDASGVSVDYNKYTESIGGVGFTSDVTYRVTINNA